MHKQVKTLRPTGNDGYRAHDLVYAQPLVTLTWFTRTPTCSWCTYEQKDDGVGGVTTYGFAQACEERRRTSGQVGRCA